MSIVIADMTMSLDGFVADPEDNPGELFDWYGNGPVTIPTAGGGFSFQVSPASAGHLREGYARLGALVCGRRLFDHANGWGGLHPMGVPVVVVSHRPAAPGSPFAFADGVQRAVETARELAGPDKWVGIASAS